MELRKTSLNVIYAKPEITSTVEQNEKQLTNFLALFAQVGFKELALNKNTTIKFNECYK